MTRLNVVWTLAITSLALFMVVLDDGLVSATYVGAAVAAAGALAALAVPRRPRPQTTGAAPALAASASLPRKEILA